MKLFMKITITGLAVIAATMLCFVKLDYERGQHVSNVKEATEINNHMQRQLPSDFKHTQHVTLLISPSKGIQIEQEGQQKRHDIENRQDTKLLNSSPKEMSTNANEQDNVPHVSKSSNPFKVSASPAFKIYVYDLPPALNNDIVKCHGQTHCYDLSKFHFGKVFSTADGINFHNTWHGLFELTMHHHLLHSAYRTMDPEQADMFYIPYYAQMLFRCSGHADGSFGSQTYEDLYHNLTVLPYFANGKPHFMTLGMPEMLGGLSKAPQWVANVLYIVLEVYHQARANHPERWYYNTVVAPYQAYGHFTERNGGMYMDTMVNKHRKIHVFLAAQSRRLGLSTSTDFRSMVVKQMPAKTKASFSTFLEKEHNALDDVVMFGTARSCEVTQAERIVEWMQNSVFCLQPLETQLQGNLSMTQSFLVASLSC